MLKLNVIAYFCFFAFSSTLVYGMEKEEFPVINKCKVCKELSENSKEIDQAYEEIGKLFPQYAAYDLGTLYLHGKVVLKNPKKAATCFQKAALLGNDDAMLMLAVLYHTGEGVEKDIKKSFRLLEEAADYGNAIAMYNLGIHYFEGKHVDKDLNKALRFFEKSKEKGLLESKEYLEKKEFGNIKLWNTLLHEGNNTVFQHF